jgi:hypothetical protein
MTVIRRYPRLLREVGDILTIVAIFISLYLTIGEILNVDAIIDYLRYAPRTDRLCLKHRWWIGRVPRPAAVPTLLLPKWSGLEPYCVF